MASSVTYWIVPSEPMLSGLGARIKCLAKEEGSIAFVPHVTVYHGPSSPPENPRDLIGSISAGIGRIKLHCREILASERFTKTLYIQFDPSDLLSELSEQLRRLSKEPSNYRLDPHLSLLYKNYPIEKKQELAVRESLDFSEIEFSEIWAVEVPSNIVSPADIAAFRTICTLKL